MGNFQGGSAYGMAQQIAGGFQLVTDRTLKRLTEPELQQLGFELEKLLRTVRSEQPAVDDTASLQDRHRRIQRLDGVRRMIQAFKTRRR